MYLPALLLQNPWHLFLLAPKFLEPGRNLHFIRYFLPPGFLLVRALGCGILLAGLGPLTQLRAEPSPEPMLPGLIYHPAPQFPPELVGIKVGDGEAIVVFTLDDTGQVSDSLALEATNEAFARAANAAVRQWRFEPPANSSGAAMATPWPRREVMQFSFKRSGVITTLSHAEAAKEGFISTSLPQLRTVQWAQLDVSPSRIKAPMPKIPKVAMAKKGAKPLLLNFIIDPEGQVRVPVVSGLDDSQTAAAVIAAVRLWRYSPPRYQQGAVAAEVNRELVLAAE